MGKICNSLVEVSVTQGDVNRDIAAKLKDLCLLKHRLIHIESVLSVSLVREEKNL